MTDELTQLRARAEKAEALLKQLAEAEMANCATVDRTIIDREMICKAWKKKHRVWCSEHQDYFYGPDSPCCGWNLLQLAEAARKRLEDTKNVK